MKVITLLNEKGGVGKSTLSTHIAMGLAARGHKVVFIDTDAQGHGSLMAGVDRQPGLYNLLARRAAWKDVLIQVSPDFYTDKPTDGYLLVCPSNVETRAIPMVVTDTSVFARRLAELSNHVDVVIIDTPPTPSMLHGSAYLATDYVLYPTQCHYMSIDGLKQSISRLDEVASHRQQYGLSPITMLGIIPTMYRRRTVDQSENLADLTESYGNAVMPPLANLTAWTEATTYNRPVWFVDGATQATQEVNSIIDRVESVVIHEQA